MSEPPDGEELARTVLALAKGAGVTAGGILHVSQYRHLWGPQPLSNENLAAGIAYATYIGWFQEPGENEDELMLTAAGEAEMLKA